MNVYLKIDATTASEGFVTVYAKPSEKRLKLRVKLGEIVYTYDLGNGGVPTPIPLQSGAGTYRFTLYKNKTENKYCACAMADIKAEIRNANKTFLFPNQYVNYEPLRSLPCLESEAICKLHDSDRDKMNAVITYISKFFVYDYVKAVTAKKGTMPDINACFNNHMGICQDLAALFACMMRVQGIPTKLVIGYADDEYHAWNSVLLDGKYELVDITRLVKMGNTAKTPVYKEERVY